jgi:thiamine biosynthesis lipoprotein
LYRPDSQLCRLNHDGVLERPHPDLVKVLRSAVDWSRLTDGAFDPTVQPLWNLYSKGGLPDSERLQAVRRFVDWKQVEVGAHRIRLGTGQSVTLNGIAQGFAADRMSSGSYLALHEQERKQSVPVPGAADSYLPSFLKDGQR